MDGEPQGGGLWALRWIWPEDVRQTVVSGPKMLIGRGEDCDIMLSGQEASRHHAELRIEQGRLLVVDVGSTNGVHVRARRVNDAELTEGQLVRIGEWLAIVARVSSPDAGAVSALTAVVPGYFCGSAMAKSLAPLRQIAGSDTPVVIQGETGTGKKGAARALHGWSGRKGSFIAVSCLGRAAADIERDLFGAGAGPGAWKAAMGGTLLLEGLAELPLPLQSKVVGAIDQGASPRIVVSTQSSLDEALRGKTLRPELFERIGGLTVRLPPLRQRQVEIPALFLQLLRKHGSAAKVDARLVESLCLYDWPFNVRELDLLVRKLVLVHGKDEVLRRSLLPARMITVTSDPDRSDTFDRTRQSLEPEVEALTEAVRRNDGNMSRAAAALGITIQKAYRIVGSSSPQHRTDTGNR